MKILFFIILSLFAIVGCAHLVFELYYRLTKTNDDNAVFLIIPQADKNIDVEFTIRSVVAKLGKLGNIGIDNIICLSDDLDEHTLRKLYLLQDDYECLSVMTKQDFKEKAGL